MDFYSIAQISASGLRYQKARVEAATMNLANIGTVKNSEGTLYRPLEAVVSTTSSAQGKGATTAYAGGVWQVALQEIEREPVKTYEPGSPMAEQDGYVLHPNIDHLGEMMTITSAVRAYEANLAAVQSARTMYSKALEIGSNS